MSTDNATAAVQQLAQISAQAQSILFNSSIKLTGTTSKGLTFLGSGVLVYSDGTEAIVATAKHNLYVFAGLDSPPAWSDQLVTAFQTGVTINYGAPQQLGSLPGQQAPISAIVPVNPAASPTQWAYDLILLKSQNPAFNTFAQAAGNSVYSNPIPIEATNMMSKAQTYLSRNNKPIFVQTGYGQVSETATYTKRTMPTVRASLYGEGKLQYRVTQPLAQATATLYNQLAPQSKAYTPYTYGVQLSADENNSTALGDSGGPLFLYVAGTGKLYLVGVTTGSDMDTAQVPCPPPGAQRVNNIATSLEPCYKNWPA